MPAALCPVIRSCEIFFFSLHLLWYVNCYCAGLSWSSTWLRFHGCCLPVKHRRHNFTAEFVVLWLLQSFTPTRVPSSHRHIYCTLPAEDPAFSMLVLRTELGSSSPQPFSLFLHMCTLLFIFGSGCDSLCIFKL